MGKLVAVQTQTRRRGGHRQPEGDQLAAGICRWRVRRVWSHVHQPSRHGGAPEQQRVPQGQTEDAVSSRSSTGERREAEARVPHTATHCLSAAYAVCKTKVGGLGGSPKKRILSCLHWPPRGPFAKNIVILFQAQLVRAVCVLTSFAEGARPRIAEFTAFFCLVALGVFHPDGWRWPRWR